jgi:hypothetical protein
VRGSLLQVRGAENCAPDGTPRQIDCEVQNFEAAVHQLVSDALVDPNRVGIIGFSRTCYSVLAALTTSKLRYRAASITDGTTLGYVQYILGGGSVDLDAYIGAPPIRNGLERWLERSPGFNMDKVSAPLQVVALGKGSLLSMWESYATLRYLHAPVDLVVLTEGQHLLTNPAERIASQGGTVDWFRFWLQDYEEPDPGKAEQYARWRELRKMQEAHAEQAKTSVEPTTVH